MTEVLEKLVEVELASGEIVYVRRLSPVTRIVMSDAAKQVHPDVDPQPYVRSLAEVAPNALDGVTIPAEDNPDYITKVRENEQRRGMWLVNAALEAGVVADTPEGREQTIERYAERIARLRDMLPGKLPEDAWAATVQHGLITTGGDRGRIFNATWDALSANEVRFALASFRREV